MGKLCICLNLSDSAVKKRGEVTLTQVYGEAKAGPGRCSHKEACNAGIRNAVEAHNEKVRMRDASPSIVRRGVQTLIRAVG